MEKLGFGLDHDRLLSIQRCIKYLTHACQCRDANCKLPSCKKMKRVLQHVKSCKLKTNGGCPICRQLIALCCYHAKHCQVAKCHVIYCSSIKNKLKHRELQEGLQQALILKRRIATMQNHRKSAAVLQTSPDNSNSSNQPSPGAEPHSSPDPPQPDIGMEPSTAPLVGALQAVAAGQTDPHMVAASVNYGKGNPVVSPPIPDLGLMAATQQMEAQMLSMANAACWEGSGYAQNPQSHQNPQIQRNPQFCLRQPTQLMGGPNNMSDSIGNSAMGPPQVMPNPGALLEGMQRTKPAWQQLLETIKSPRSAQQQQQIRAILKSNPRLMAAFIKQRTAQKQQQQQQVQMQEPVPQMMSGEPNRMRNMGNV